MCKTVSHQLSTHHQSSGRFFYACKDMEYFSMMQEKGQKMLTGASEDFRENT
jgi:hypothetical protein